MNKELQKGKLLDDNGNLVDAGFAFHLDRDYKRSDIKASKWKIKEWDYYYIGNDNYGLALTIDDNSYMSMASASFLDLKNATQVTTSKIGWFTFGKVNLPSTTVIGDTKLSGKGYDFNFYNDGNTRHLVCSMKNFTDKKDLYCDITLKETTDGSMVIATPFNKKAHFYYNQKINCQKANGYFTIGDEKYEFNETDSRAVLDWGRGVWTYINTWYWGSASGIQNGKEFGFNLGYGFGDTSAASENMIFYDKKAYKMDDVIFDIPKDKKGNDDFLTEWDVVSKSKDINLKFKPIIDRHSDTNVLIIRSNQHQVFGIFNGTVTIEGKVIDVKNLIGFAEKVYNKW